MTHYNTSANSVSLRCDGDHQWSDPFLDGSQVNMQYEDGVVYVKFAWVVRKKCTKKHTNDVPSTTSMCQKIKTVANGSQTYPITEIENV